MREMIRWSYPGRIYNCCWKALRLSRQDGENGINKWYEREEFFNFATMQSMISKAEYDAAMARQRRSAAKDYSERLDTKKECRRKQSTPQDFTGLDGYPEHNQSFNAMTQQRRQSVPAQRLSPRLVAQLTL